MAVGQPWKSAKPEQTGRPARLVTDGAARRELEDLRSAINHHRREGLCSEIVSSLPARKSEARERWLTRCRRRACSGRRGAPSRSCGTSEPERAVGRHVARFILAGLYTGTRSGAICGAALMPTIGRGHVDLERGVFYRRAIGRRADQKAPAAGEATRSPARAPAALATARLAKQAVVEWNGKPVELGAQGIRDGCEARPASRAEVTPHILRHTARPG